MADKFTQTSTALTRTFSQGLIKDIADEFLEEGVWTHARNLVTNTHLGEKGHVSNEPSNFLCANIPYTVIGTVRVRSQQWLIFSTDDTNSEIGYFNEADCSYKKVVNSPCLNFKKSNLIRGVSKLNYDKSRSVYFVDGLNPDKYLNLDRIPYKTTGRNLSTEPGCFIPEYTNELDCDELLLSSKVTVPKYSIKRAVSAGQLLNGSYQAVIAYSVNGIRVTDYFTPSNIQSVWNESGIGGAIDITISNLDEKFDEYELVVIGIVNQQTVAKRIGYYSTSQSSVHLSQIPDSLPTVDLAIIPLQNPLYYKSDKIYELNNYLLRTGVYTRPEINYQQLANNIVTRWVEVEYNFDYYFKGGNNAGYMRDEVYSFFIRWIYNTGHKSASYHIPGRAVLSDEKSFASGENVITGEQYKWEVQDTSTVIAASGITVDGGVIKRKGLMSYWESTEKYPDDQPEVWGSLCGKQIRHHKFPSNNTSHIHSTNGEKILILGVEFDNIVHPTDFSGNPIKEIVGYEILRGSREGQRSVVAKGMFNNMREYATQLKPDDKFLYQNYPYNDLSPDKYLTTYNLRAQPNVQDDAFPASKYKKDFFSFHSPDTVFNKPFLGGNYISIYTEETGKAISKFETPYKHPKGKLITNTSLVGAGIIGVGLGVLSVLGKTTTGKTGKVGFLGTGVEFDAHRESGTISAIPDMFSALLAAPVQTAASLIIMALQASFFIGQGIDQTLSVIYNLVQARDYALQLNSHCFYNNASNRLFRRNVTDGKYVGDGLQSIGDYTVQNLFRNKYVLFRTQGEIADPLTTDSTRKRVQDLRSWDDPFDPFTTTSSAYYGAVKVVYKNQYGQIDSINQVPLGAIWFETQPDSTPRKSDVLFGGDVYINRYTEKNPFFFFNQWLYDQPDGIEYNYRNHVNSFYPRYWANFERYDISDFRLEKDEDAKELFEKTTKDAREKEGFKGYAKNYLNTPSNFHSLDKNGSKSGGIFSIKNGYFYLFANGVRDFFVESEINLAYRDQDPNPGKKHYSPYLGYSDVSEIFRSDLIKNETTFKYDNSLSTSKIYANYVKWGSTLPRDYDPETYEKRFQYFQDRVVYSLQHQSGLKKDNWLTYLANNYKDFNARINTIKDLNGTGAIILYENKEPEEFIGQDQLQTTAGVKLTIGDAGLFQQAMRTVVNADDMYEYGTCINERSAINTPYGLYYISQNTGKILQYTSQGLIDISQGIKFWLVENLPSKLLEKFPDFKYYDNPVLGVGCEAIYDPTYEKIYFSKKDYLPKSNKISYVDGQFRIESGRTTTTAPTGGTISIPTYTNISLTDPTYFEDCSWTVSYDPQTRSWISFHDWHPDFMLPSREHFYTIINNKIWTHNNTNNSFCKFYGQNYPFEIEFPVITPNNITTLRSVEYYLETYKNSNRDRFHVFEDNFDEAIIYNSEQVSGVLKLNKKPKNNPYLSLTYPIVESNHIKILFSKEENKYRFNQFWDVTKDRGEFSLSEQDIWSTRSNGYVRDLNTLNLNYSKNPIERKKFRHYANRVLLIKSISNDLNMILKIFNTKNLQSPR